MMKRQITIGEVHAEIAGHCGEIAALFKPGARVTVVVRNPNEESKDADAIFTDDDLDLVIASIERLKKKDAKILKIEDLL